MGVELVTQPLAFLFQAFAFGLAFIISVQDGSVRGDLAVALFESLSVALFDEIIFTFPCYVVRVVVVVGFAGVPPDQDEVAGRI